MTQKRTHIVLPDDLLGDIDTLVGPRGRSAFLVDVLREEIRRRRLLQILSDPKPVWRDEDHPELAEGAAAWVRKMRDEDLRLEQDKLADLVQHDEE